jgi:transcription-repair coupling factor (superfamily II helicase)
MSLDFLRETAEFKRLVHALKLGKGGLKISGLTESAKPYFLAMLAIESKRRVVLVRSHSSPLFPMEEQCRFFLNQLSSDFKIRALPALSENPYHEIQPSLDSVSSRMSFFHDLLHGLPSLVVTNLFGLLRPFPHIKNLENFFLEIGIGERIGRDDLLRIIGGYGYTREDLVNSAGEYAWRGGIVDVFSPWESYPFRIEFSGDEILSLRQFNPSTQKSVRKGERLHIPSLVEYPTSPRFVEEWRQIALSKVSSVLSDEIEGRIDRIRERDFQPTFSFLSLLHREHFVSFQEYLKDYLIMIDDSDAVEKEWNEAREDLREQYQALKKERRFLLPPDEMYPPHLWESIKKKAILWKELSSHQDRSTVSFSFQSVPKFKNKIPLFLRYLKRLQEDAERCLIYFTGEGVRQKLGNLLSQHQIPYLESASPVATPQEEAVVLLLGKLEHGFGYPKERISFFGEKDIFTEERILVSRPPVRPFLSHFQDLKAGDYVVHTDCGIGVFKGLVKIDVDQKNREFIELLYRDNDKLFVPVEDLNLVQKFSKVGSANPSLSKLGTPSWERIKARTKKAIQDMAKELLHLYAQRKAAQGFRFSPAGEWQEEFERIFEYEETEDQLRSVKDITDDMESDYSMDRLLVGDVGYGKTEVAMRAAFKAVMDGKQVAVLCPTTVLANQHLNTFRTRMVLFPVRIEALSRIQSKSQQRKIVEDLEKGLVDVIIGTHRLLSKDVKFRDLGILIVDEEQRFGVKHKERIKQMKTNIDVLTLSATPIPRTLNLSLAGLRDMSIIETPPKDRLAIHTVVAPFSLKLVASAIKMELARNGQVYYIHNRIDDIEAVASKIERLVPKAKVAVVHGQMAGATLERRMIDFINQKYNVLVSTTIIENGIDIPLVNTLIVDQAHRFGLAQLYQLRGRVGRSSRQAVAYLLVPPFMELTPLAKERLKALQEFSELGSGFRLAAKDLEIRGAGSFLGSKQHGYMEAVGFDYYMYLLGRTIKEMKGGKVEERKPEINLKLDIRIPEEYLPQINLRLNLYKRISSVEDLKEIQEIKEEIKDRFGPLPSSVKNLLSYGMIKFLAQESRVYSIDLVRNKMVIKFYPHTSADLTGLQDLLKKHSGSITPQGVMSFSLPGEGDAQVMGETISILKELSLM